MVNVLLDSFYLSVVYERYYTSW